MQNRFQESFNKLSAYCESQSFMGYDPYDGLESTFFKSLPWLKNNRLARLAWIQGFKKSPLNLRPLLGVGRGYNPKALGLFLSGYVLLYKSKPEKEYLDKINFFSQKILELSTQGYSGHCWGYNFDWESRAFYLPRFTPTIVVSSFVGNALLDAFEILSDPNLLKAARSTCDFILNDLNRTYNDKGDFIFSYSGFDNSFVFNASLLGARLLARVYSHTGETALKDEARKSVNYVYDCQNDDGSWTYGKLPFHQWTDNFHTGYNLECIYDYMRFTGDHSYSPGLEKGYKYYKNTFFRQDGAAKYYNNSLYPVDIHAPAQFIITTCKLRKLHDDAELVNKVLKWTVSNMQSSRGYFYYQIKKLFKIRIPYMRWSQAWMFYAMSCYFNETKSLWGDPLVHEDTLIENNV